MDKLIFDFDGVLADSLEAHANFYADWGRKHNLVITRDQAQTAMMGSIETYFAMLGVPDHLRDGMESDYASDFANYSCQLFPGIQEALDELSRHNAVITLASSNRRPFIEKHIKPIGRHFRLVKTRDEHYYKSDAIANIIQTLGGNTWDYTLIGDTQWDIDTSQRAGVNFHGAGWGWHKLKSTHQYQVSATPQEMVRALIG